MHAHASDRQLTEKGAAKLWVNSDGSTIVQKRGILSDIELNKIQKFIKQNYMELYEKWSQSSDNGFYGDK